MFSKQRKNKAKGFAGHVLQSVVPNIANLQANFFSKAADKILSRKTRI